jgi:hypothetical protein
MERFIKLKVVGSIPTARAIENNTLANLSRYFLWLSQTYSQTNDGQTTPIALSHTG